MKTDERIPNLYNPLQEVGYIVSIRNAMLLRLLLLLILLMGGQSREFAFMHKNVRVNKMPTITIRYTSTHAVWVGVVIGGFWAQLLSIGMTA